MEKKIVSQQEFDAWVSRMYNEFVGSRAILFEYDIDTIYIYLRSKVGKAKCHPNDCYNKLIGIAYAWARCTGQPEYYIKKVKYKPTAGKWVYISIINSKIRCLLKYMCEGVDYYCFQLSGGELTLVKKTDVTDIAPAD